MKFILEKFIDLISIPYSLILCIRIFPLKIALKMPLLVRFNACINLQRGCKVSLKTEKIKPAMIRIGFGDIGILDKKYERTIIKICGTLIFNGITFIGQGARVSCGKKGIIEFGENFRNSGGLSLVCEDNIKFGKNVLIGWNTTIMDCDYHQIINLKTNILSNMTKSIIFGDNTWQAMNSVVLKGSIIPNGCIIGAGSVVHYRFTEPNCLIAGNPAVVCKYNLTRKID